MQHILVDQLLRRTSLSSWQLVNQSLLLHYWSRQFVDMGLLLQFVDLALLFSFSLRSRQLGELGLILSLSLRSRQLVHRSFVHSSKQFVDLALLLGLSLRSNNWWTGLTSQPLLNWVVLLLISYQPLASLEAICGSGSSAIFWYIICLGLNMFGFRPQMTLNTIQIPPGSDVLG